MSSFVYKGLTFEPYRNFYPGEKNTYYKNMQKYESSPPGFSHTEFYTAAGKDNAKDLFWLNGDIVLPSGNHLFLYQDTTLPEHFIRETTKSTKVQDLIGMIDAVGADGFYPTPSDIAKEMLSSLKMDYIESVLEPSAGKGDLANAVKEWFASGYKDCDTDIDCIEINPDLRAILRGKGFNVVHDDFLGFHTFKHYDLVIMNPPFAEGDKHLMHALELIKSGGTVVCLLNAETIRNPYTKLRKALHSELTKHDALVTYFENPFADAERPTEVAVAMVKVTIAPASEKSDIFEHINKTTPQPDDQRDVTELAPSEFFERIVRQFEVEAAAGMELIRQYNNMQPYIMSSVDANDKYAAPILRLNVGKSDSYGYCGCSVNKYLEITRAKYWQALLSNPKFTGQLTSALQKKYREMVNDLRHYDFSLFNIEWIADQMRAEMNQGVEDAIMAIFQQFTQEHAWYPECRQNIHYYNGWATNKAHMINKKVIIPSHGIFSDYTWSRDTFRVREACEHLSDIEKVFNYLDGHKTAEVDLSTMLENANRQGNTKKIPCKYFDVTFYKKGTTHIFFRDQALLDKFNIYASRKMNWLPPCYGRVRYADMNSTEKAVIDDFQGAEAYEKVMQNSGYYLIEASEMLALPEAQEKNCA